MKTLLTAAFAVTCLVALPRPAAAGEDGFVTLFDGEDLSAWTMASGARWVVEDGEITLKGNMDGREHNRVYLWTKEVYSDFVLELEFKITENSNSGVYLRTGNRKDPVNTGIEVQVIDSYGVSEWDNRNCAGAIYYCVTPTENAIKPPGQWNRYRITCDKNRITVELNGRTVSEMNLDRWTKAKRNPDGSPNRFRTALKDFARSGCVGLQDHGSPVWYRNIRIKRLND